MQRIAFSEKRDLKVNGSDKQSQDSNWGQKAGNALDKLVRMSNNVAWLCWTVWNDCYLRETQPTYRHITIICLNIEVSVFAVHQAAGFGERRRRKASTRQT